MALEFDGINQYINCGNDASLAATNNFTIVARVYWPADSTYRLVVEKARIVVNVYEGWDIIQMLDNKCRFEVLWHPGNSTNILSDAALAAGEHLIVIVRDNGTSKMYIDNVLQAATMISTPDATALDFLIGIGPDKIAYPWKNYNYETRFYARPFSAAEVAIVYYSKGADNLITDLRGRWLMNEKPDGIVASGANTVIDISGNGNHGTPVNSPVYRAGPVRLVRTLVSTGIKTL